MKTITRLVVFALASAFLSCQSNVEKYEAQKKKHFGESYYTTITFENKAKVSEETMADAAIESGTFEIDTVIDGNSYSSNYKYLVSVSKQDGPIELLLSGSGITSGGTPQEMTSGDFVVGTLRCLSWTNVFSGNSGECLRRLVATAQFDCCFSNTPQVDCWISCPLNPEDNWPTDGPPL